MKRALLFSLCILAACSSSPTPKNTDPIAADQTSGSMAPVTTKKFEIHPGMTRAAIESVLGAPFSVEESMRGVEVAYMPGMGDMMRNMQAQMQAAQGAGRAMGILDSVAGVAGALGGPAGGMIAGAGSGLIGAGASAFGSAAEPTMPDMANMEMFMVQYQNNIAVTVRRQNMGGMAEGPAAE